MISCTLSKLFTVELLSTELASSSFTCFMNSCSSLALICPFLSLSILMNIYLRFCISFSFMFVAIYIKPILRRSGFWPFDQFSNSFMSASSSCLSNFSILSKRLPFIYELTFPSMLCPCCLDLSKVSSLGCLAPVLNSDSHWCSSACFAVILCETSRHKSLCIRSFASYDRWSSFGSLKMFRSLFSTFVNIS